jgi:hypothetical protein
MSLQCLFDPSTLDKTPRNPQMFQLRLEPSVGKVMGDVRLDGEPVFVLACAYGYEGAGDANASGRCESAKTGCGWCRKLE